MSYCCPCCPVPSVSFSTCAVHDVWTSEPYCLVNCPRQAPIGCQGCCISKGILRQWHIELEEHDLFSQPVINSHMQPRCSKSRIYNLHSLSLSSNVCRVHITTNHLCMPICLHKAVLASIGNGWQWVEVWRDAIHRMDDQSFSRNKMKWGCQEANHPL